MGPLSMGFGALGDPAGRFVHPAEVVRDPGLTLYEKRAILASWASDACAVEAAPALRRVPGGRLVSIDEVMDALRLLDREARKSMRRQATGPCWNTAAAFPGAGPAALRTAIIANRSIE